MTQLEFHPLEHSRKPDEAYELIRAHLPRATQNRAIRSPGKAGLGCMGQSGAMRGRGLTDPTSPSRALRWRRATEELYYDIGPRHGRPVFEGRIPDGSRGSSVREVL